MKETFTNAEIFGAFPSLDKVAQLKLPVKTSFAVAKLVQSLSPAYQAIETVRNSLIQKYAIVHKDEKGKDERAPSIKQTDDNWPQFAAEFGELLALEVEVEFDKVALPDTAIEIEPATILSLMRFINI